MIFFFGLFLENTEKKRTKKGTITNIRAFSCLLLYVSTLSQLGSLHRLQSGSYTQICNYASFLEQDKESIVYPIHISGGRGMIFFFKEHSQNCLLDILWKVPPVSPFFPEILGKYWYSMPEPHNVPAHLCGVEVAKTNTSVPATGSSYSALRVK